MSLWTAAELRAATGGRLTAEVAVTGISIDTRTLAPGDLFIALRDARDGHDFVAQALARGAAAAMVDHAPPGLGPEAPLLFVMETLQGLTALGAAGRARCAGRVAAVTGSVGKTGTKEMLRHLLGALGPTHAAQASYNNHWGVPLTLARLPAGARFAVIEIGMNNPGEIAPLTRLARPHVAAITNVAEAHIGHMGGMAAIAEEKGSIALGLEPGGVAVLPRDNAFFPRLAEIAQAAGAARILSFGRDASAGVRLLEATTSAAGTTARIAVEGREIAIAMPAIGLQHAENATCALAVVAALGEDPARAAPALSAYAPGAGRGADRVVALPGGGTALLVDDSYNGQPPAMRAALRNLGLRPATRRIAVLGDMRELGEHSAALHRGLAEEAGAADLVFACGPEMAHLLAALPAAKRGAHAPDSASLAPLVKSALQPGDVVLVKGSLGSRMALVVQALTGDAK
ncbi:UDP-N-acetylmuramoyl-tripeptide--D-alanyl-D-alanine ligase [Siccirubricoccus sp. KC 17139]|uniref:UDP-N-acetylmuramoyl-tripeptide--D-alanyl-D-alanine ligase n=1 Tax=Siccirubricoccus soli TaxID=2899147 RepID=A0ABT1DCP9_9PROT|nr:UDP-N-acetylmuramoyl-tripeptide--D-alanyl-D-alanine ligase [Siccirubricoccus soli]MCO6419716.1 UDP-N-acetylmuramoyl-tripeptide--D-alanyl-D-alanine ligase [Siccirubricoccus soli]MCP2685851.1 UDP-N-acetylmuramoyl-tripeptide--D-alanyl-D-alanine ligase [Siccirubricoccus soli]